VEEAAVAGNGRGGGADLGQGAVAARILRGHGEERAPTAGDGRLRERRSRRRRRERRCY
jgi:hypothetical protein